MIKRTCKDICKKFKVTKPAGRGRYDSGHGRCQICDIWIDYHGAHTKDGKAATIHSEGWFCNCCNFRIRRKPRNIEYKSKLRQPHPSDGDGVDLSHFDKRRARMIRGIVSCIPHNRDDLDVHEFRDKLSRDRTLSISAIESEFDADIGDILNLAYSKTPNKISLIAELERVHTIIGGTPTKLELEEHSGLKISQYEAEFESWEHMLERLGHDPFYRDRKGAIPTGGKPHGPATLTDGGIDLLNRRIKHAFDLIKSSPSGAYLSDLTVQLGVSEKETSGVLARLVRIEGISKKKMHHNGMTLDTLLLYDPPHP